MTVAVTNVTTALSTFNLAPEKNETTEIGVKADVLDKKLSLAAAAFLTEKTNMRATNPITSTAELVGSVEAPGVELSATGKLTDAWQVIASYTYVHARVTKTTLVGQVNNVPFNTPDNTFSLWTTYDLNPQWQIGGGAFFNGSSYGDMPNTAIVPSYWRYDAMAAYKINAKSTLQFNVYNLTDEYYAASAYSNWYVPGPSRTFAMTYRYTWN